MLQKEARKKAVARAMKAARLAQMATTPSDHKYFTEKYFDGYLTESNLICFFTQVSYDHGLPRKFGEAIAEKFCKMQRNILNGVNVITLGDSYKHPVLYYPIEKIHEFLNWVCKHQAGSKVKKRFCKLHEHLTFEMPDGIEQLLGRDNRYWSEKIVLWKYTHSECKVLIDSPY